MLSGYRFDWCWNSCGSVVTESGEMETASSGASPVKILELVKVLMPGRCGSFAALWRRPCFLAQCYNLSDQRLVGATETKDCERGLTVDARCRCKCSPRGRSEVYLKMLATPVNDHLLEMPLEERHLEARFQSHTDLLARLSLLSITYFGPGPESHV